MESLCGWEDQRDLGFVEESRYFVKSVGFPLVSLGFLLDLFIDPMH